MKTKFKKGDVIMVTEKKNYYTNYLMIFQLEYLDRMWTEMGFNKMGRFNVDDFHITLISKGEFK